MINHTRTLLVNNRVTDSPVYMPPDFSPVLLSGTPLHTIDTLLFPADTVKARMSMVDSILPLLHRPELMPYVLAFDSRITYDPVQRGNVSVTRFIQSVVSTPASSTLTTITNNILTQQAIQMAAPGLFIWQEYPYREWELGQLRRAWTSTQDRLLSAGALLLAFVYQIEKIRITT